MVVALPFVLASLSTGAAPPTGEPPEEELYVVADVSADKTRCNEHTAERIDLERLASAGEGLRGRCVAVNGYLSGRALFANRADTRVRYAQSVRTLRARRVGLYGLSKALPGSAPRRGFYKVIGTVGDCDRLAEGAIMVMGYCHYTVGPYLAVSELRRLR